MIGIAYLADILVSSKNSNTTYFQLTVVNVRAHSHTPKANSNLIVALHTG